MNIPKVEIPKDKERLEMQIKALEWQVKMDEANRNETDRDIHQRALNDLKEALEEMK